MKRLEWFALLIGCTAFWACEDGDTSDSGLDIEDALTADADLAEDAASEDEDPTAEERAEAQKAFEYLNLIRQNPEAYSDACHVDLSSVDSNLPLHWNDILAQVAETKAKDMRDRNYFEHVDPDGNGINIKIAEAGYELPEAWYSDPASNYFESLAAGAKGGEDAIRILIEDKGIDPPGHRQHLLGMSDFWSDLQDIGIGYVEGLPKSPYISYMSIVIAKHHY